MNCNKKLEKKQKKYCSKECQWAIVSHMSFDPWNKNKKDCYSKETLKQMSESMRGIHSNKSKGKKVKERMSIAQKKRFRERGSHWTGRKHKKETILKIRKATINNRGFTFPNYNKEACEYFRKFDKEHNTKGRYAVYGGGEYFIEELGYWPDYINFNMKLIMEWDEPRHYKGGKLKRKDVDRQREIQEYFSDFEFIRIKTSSK